ncbi:MAG: hypothetical protein SGILL_010131 [Bacillariaceae sp.]
MGKKSQTKSPKGKTASPASASNKNNNSSGKKNKGSKKRKLPTTFLDAQSLDIVVGPPPKRQLYTTPVASEVVKEIFLERLVKEVVTPLLRRPLRTKYGNKTKTTTATTPVMEERHVLKNGRLIKQMVPITTTIKEVSEKPTESADDSDSNRIWKERILMGTNQCSKLLETLAANNDATKETVAAATGASPYPRNPTLMVLARDIYPPTMLAHVPQLAQELQIPVLLLPGKASLELGKALKVRRTSILMFLETAATRETSDEDDEDDDNEVDPIDSFVAFIKEQLPKQSA